MYGYSIPGEHSPAASWVGRQACQQKLPWRFSRDANCVYQSTLKHLLVRNPKPPTLHHYCELKTWLNLLNQNKLSIKPKASLCSLFTTPSLTNQNRLWYDGHMSGESRGRVLSRKHQSGHWKPTARGRGKSATAILFEGPAKLAALTRAIELANARTQNIRKVALLRFLMRVNC